MSKFTNNDEMIIRRHYPKMGKKMCYMLPHHTPNAIQDKTKKMGIHKLCWRVEDFLISHDDAVYLAAIIDGEGSIGLWKRSNRVLCYNPQIAIYNTNYKLVEWVESVLFGIPHRFYIDNRGVREHKTAYNIAIRGIAPTHKLLEEIKPYLKIKDEQAKLLFEFDNARIMRPIRQQNSNHDHEIYERLRVLNSKGSSA